MGSTQSQRGWLRPEANAATEMPAAAVGLAPAGQPLATATCTVGMTCLSTGLITGCGPTVSGGEATGPTPVSPGIAWTERAAATAATVVMAGSRRDIVAPDDSCTAAELLLCKRCTRTRGAAVFYTSVRSFS